jgi:solute carrier family 13 (sodium-dependent dicarboxylate transporter), member 2/3/5
MSAEYEIARNQRANYQRVGFILGPLLFATLWMLPAPDGLSIEGWHVVALAAWMASWWATEAIPVPATSLLPLIILPLSGITTLGAAASPYSSPIIFLLLGGFIIAMAMERWNLHRRIALNILVRFGSKPNSLILGFMVATSFLSMWISNTATTLMMIPIALSVADTVTGGKMRHPFTIALVLSIAYAASIGGMGTIVGTPPNLIVVGYLQQNMGIEISFVQWMSFGVPIVLLLVPAAWFVLTRFCYDVDKGISVDGQRIIEGEISTLGAITVPEMRTAMVFILVATLWVTRPILDNLAPLQYLSDTIIAVFGAVILFVIPAGCRDDEDSFLLDWETAVRIPWGVILLFGGGLSLAAAITSTGLAAWLGQQLVVLTTFDLIILMLALVTMVVFLTELTSNTATTAALMPILGAIAVAGAIDPMLLAAPAAVAASCAFMLPVATAPNAIIFAGGRVTIPDMVGAGFRLNLVAILVVTGLCYALVPVIFS